MTMLQTYIGFNDCVGNSPKMMDGDTFKEYLLFWYRMTLDMFIGGLVRQWTDNATHEFKFYLTFTSENVFRHWFKYVCVI